jgi:hypothetical protein
MSAVTLFSTNQSFQARADQWPNGHDQSNHTEIRDSKRRIVTRYQTAKIAAASTWCPQGILWIQDASWSQDYV